MGYKTVGLISGGKDSCYNLVECVKNGHELVALAHLHPPTNVHEMDSFMYQTVGSELVEAIATCLELPLVLREISGTAVAQSIDYASTAGDEVEDLFELLQDVQRKFPEVEAVAAGAVLSTYQRNRVENVCRRLGLVSLAFLWQREQADLFCEMIEAGMECMLVKVASLGLGKEMLGKGLAGLKEEFMELEEKFGFHVCGEGGEYESITLDCPLFHRRIVVDRQRVVVTDDVPFAPVAHLVVEEFHLEDKEEVGIDEGESGGTKDGDKNDVLVEEEGKGSKRFVVDSGGCRSEEDGVEREVIGFNMQQTVNGSSCWLAIMAGEEGSSTLEERTRGLFERLFQALTDSGFGLNDTCFVTLYLGDMSLFQEMNSIYCKLFPQVDPPSRACIELPLAAPGDVVVELLAVKGKRNVLHVRSLSYWAPVCIGPYSQANVIDPGVVFVAGQIALDPASMKLDPSVGQGKAEVELVLQHIQRILACLDSTLDEIHVLTVQLVISLSVYPYSHHEELLRVVTAAVGKAPTIVTVVPRLPKDSGIEVQCTACQSKLVNALAKASDDACLQRSTFLEGVEAIVMHLSKPEVEGSAQQAAMLVKEKCQKVSTGESPFIRVFYNTCNPRAVEALECLKQLWSQASIVPIPVLGLIRQRVLSVAACKV